MKISKVNGKAGESALGRLFERKSVEVERILTWGIVFAVLCHNLGCLWFLVG